MKVVTVREFRDHATAMLRSEDVILITRDGLPAGFFLPWDARELPSDAQSQLFLRLSEQIGSPLREQRVSEVEVLADFAAHRSRSRR